MHTGTGSEGILGQQSHQPEPQGSQAPGVSFISGGFVVLADYPCDMHLARYQGPSHRIYVNVYREEEAIKLKLSVCQACLESIMGDWLSRALAQDEKGIWNPLTEDETLAALWMDAGTPTRPLRRLRAS